MDSIHKLHGEILRKRLCGKILDVGCGCLPPYQSWIDHCEITQVAPLVNTHFEDFFTEEKYDWIIFVHSLEHLQFPWACLFKAQEMLEPDGRIILIVPNREGWFNSAKKGLESPHYNVWDFESFHFALLSRGFIIFEKFASFVKIPCLDLLGLMPVCKLLAKVLPKELGFEMVWVIK